MEIRVLMSDVLGVAGLAVSIIGFGVTAWQLIRTANATVATKDAIVQANKRMLLNHLLVLLPQLKTLESDLDSAIASGSQDAAIRALNGFSHAANQVASLLESQDEQSDTNLIAELRGCATNASASKSTLVGGISKPMATVLRTVSQQVSDVSAKCAGLTTKYQVKVV